MIALLMVAPAAPHGLAAQSAAAPSDQRRLDSLLLAQASRVLARYNETFYVLGLGVTRDDRIVGIGTRHWPPLEAAPDQWRDSLLAAMREWLPRLRSAAYLSDRWRQQDAARSDSTFAVFHFESDTGACSESRRAYHLTSSGQPDWAQPVWLPCRREIWARPVAPPR